MSKFKETEFGFIPIDWEIKTVQELKASEKSAIAMGPFGSNIKAENFVPHGVPVIRGTNLNYNKFVGGEFVFLTEEKADELKGSNCSTGDLVFTHRGTLGQVALIPEGKYRRYVISQSGMKLTVDQSKVINEFLFYFFKSKQGQYQLLKNESQVGVPSLSNPLSTLRQLEVPVPSLKEQKNIAETLNSLDSKIDLLHRQNKTLEQLAETLFRQWFVESPTVKMVDGKLGDLIETTLGGEWGKESLEGDHVVQVLCIRGTDIADLQVGLANRAPVRFVTEKKFRNVQPKDGDLILEISGGTDDQSTGRTIYIDAINRTLFRFPLVFSNFCRLLRPQSEEYTYFLYMYFQYLYHQDEFFSIENGSSGIKNLDYKYLLFDLHFSLPQDRKAILNFNDEVKIYFQRINKNKIQIQNLIQLRETLLPKLMSGEVRVDLSDVNQQEEKAKKAKVM